MSGLYNMPSNEREHIDEVLADRNRGDRRVPTPIVEGTGKRDGGNLSHRGQDEKDITIGEATNYQTGIVTPDIEEESNIEGTRRTLDRDIAELEKATGAVKDELEAQIAGKYKPQNIHHGQKKETRQSDLLESEAEKLKSLDSILKRLDVLKDRQSSFDEEDNTDPLHAAAVKRKKKLIEEAKRDNVGLGWTKGIVDDDDDKNKADTNTSHKGNSERNDPEELKRKQKERRDKKIASSRKRSGEKDRKRIAEGLPDLSDDDIGKSDDFHNMYGKDAYINPDATDEEIHDWVDEQERTNEHYKKWQKNFIDSFDDIGKSTNVGDDNTKHFSSRRGTLPKGKESVSDNPNLKRLRESKKKPVKDYSGRTDLTEEEAKKLRKYKAHKSKYTSWNRMDAGVRNEHRNTLGLSSIADYDQLPSADQKKVKGAGFWKENLKEQPIKEGTHFGDTGSTPELQAEKRTTTKPKQTTGKIGSLRRRRRLGKSLNELKIYTAIAKLTSGDDDLERVQHTTPTLSSPTANTTRGTPPISTRPTANQGVNMIPEPTKSPWGEGENQTKPEQANEKERGSSIGTMPKTTGRGAASETAQPKTGTGSGNKGVVSQGHDKKDYEMDDITHKKIPSKEEKRSNQKIRGGLGTFKDRMRDRTSKKLGTAKRKLEGFASGYQDREKPRSGGADTKIDNVTPHKTDTSGSRSDSESPSPPKEPFKPSRTSAGTGSERPADNDPTRAWNKEERNREDDVPFKREEGEKPEEKKETKRENTTTGTVGSTRGRGRKGKKETQEDKDQSYDSTRRTARGRAGEKTDPKEDRSGGFTRRNRGRRFKG